MLEYKSFQTVFNSITHCKLDTTVRALNQLLFTIQNLITKNLISKNQNHAGDECQHWRSMRECFAIVPRSMYDCPAIVPRHSCFAPVLWPFRCGRSAPIRRPSLTLPARIPHQLACPTRVRNTLRVLLIRADTDVRMMCNCPAVFLRSFCDRSVIVSRQSHSAPVVRPSTHFPRVHHTSSPFRRAAHALPMCLRRNCHSHPTRFRLALALQPL